MNIKEQSLIGQLVADDYRTATIFKKNGIDFCCQGNRTIQDACSKNNLDINNLIGELQETINSDENNNTNFQTWPLDLLVDYIVKTHHRYVESRSNELKPYLDKICNVHGEHHPELYEIRDLFYESAVDLANHMKKEEIVLFPYIKRMVSNQQDHINLKVPGFGTIQNPIQMMMEEHSFEGERFRKISELSDNYTPSESACNTYRVTLAMLKEFEQDLHLHIHIENNILFPKAIELEKELLK